MLYFELLFCSRPRSRVYYVKVLPTWNNDYLSISIYFVGVCGVDIFLYCFYCCSFFLQCWWAGWGVTQTSWLQLTSSSPWQTHTLPELFHSLYIPGWLWPPAKPTTYLTHVLIIIIRGQLPCLISGPAWPLTVENSGHKWVYKAQKDKSKFNLLKILLNTWMRFTTVLSTNEGNWRITIIENYIRHLG